ncbi:MAG: hypothetical protein KAS32_03450 [Candidatus Peribacteraceae bacterium]|nr:hypothetical protein [Candidatus Peribacteraceae bacterium]
MRLIPITLITLLILLNSSPVFAGWQTTFDYNYKTKSIGHAVIVALYDGITPIQIVDRGLTFEGLNPQNLIMALYCSGVKGSDVREASIQGGISTHILLAGYKKSIVECSDTLADSQAYTPTPTGFSGGRSPSSGGSSFASPSTF